MKILVNNVDISSRLLEFKRSNEMNSDALLLGNSPIVQVALKLDNQDGFLNDLLDYPFIISYDNQNQMGFYRAYQKPEKYTGELSVTLYDNMYLFNLRYESQLEYPTTIAKQLEEMSVKVGIPIHKDRLSQTVLSKEVNWYDNTIPMRNYLGWIAELDGFNVFANADGEIVFRDLATASHSTIDIETYSKDELITFSRVCFDNGLLKLEKGTDEGNTLYLSSNNPYIDSETSLDEIYQKYVGLSFYSVSGVKMANINGWYLTDLVNYNDEFVFMPLSISENYGGGQYSIATVSGEMNTANNEMVINKIDISIRIKRIQTIVDQNNQTLKILAQDLQDGIGKVTEFEQTLNDISLKISQTEDDIRGFVATPIITLSAKYGTQQVYSPSSDIYTPDYRVQNQMVTPVIKIKGKEEVIDPSKIQWEKADGEFEDYEQVIDGTLVLTDNFSQKATTYICTYSYDTGKSVSAELSFSLVSDGTKGTEGKDAATCSILASGSTFASVDGTIYEPEQITLIPQFQECLYAKWQYSNDGLTWTDVISGQDGLTIDSTTKELVISNQTFLLADGQKVLNIKLQSDIAGIASTFTIIKIWTPDQEVFDNIKDEVADVQQNILEMNTLITSTAEEIVLEALQSYTESSDYNTFKETVESQLKLMAEQMTLQFTQQQSILEAVNGGLQEQITNITKYFTFDIDGLTIGQPDSPNKVVVDNDEISIVVNGNKVQTFNSAGKGVIPQLEVTQEFNFFGYTITQDGSGNVNLDYTG